MPSNLWSLSLLRFQCLMKGSNKDFYRGRGDGVGEGRGRRDSFCGGFTKIIFALNNSKFGYPKLIFYRFYFNYDKEKFFPTILQK